MRGPIACIDHEVVHLWDDETKSCVCGAPAQGCLWTDRITDYEQGFPHCPTCYPEGETP